MKKLSIILFALLLTTPLHTGRGLETWWDYNIIGDLGDKAQIRIEQEYEFSHGLERLFFHFSENILFFKLAHWIYLGPYVRLARGKFQRNWIKEAQPGIIMRNWFKIKGVPFFTRLKVFRRVIEQLKDSTAARFTLGVDFAHTKKLTFYAADEVFYNYADTSDIDQNYTFIGMHGVLDEHYSYDIYYNVYALRQRPRKNWHLATALAFGFTVNF